MRLIVALLLLSIPCISSKAQWTRVHPASPIQRYLHYAYAEPATQQLLAIGNDIVSSGDGGDSWQITAANKLPVHFRPDQKYADIHFTGRQTGHIAFEGSIYKTSNGGNSWDRKLSLDPNHSKYAYSAYFHSITFIDETNGWAVGDFRKIFRTTNGGNTWEEVSWSAVTAPYIAYTDVQFINSSTGFISGYEVSDILMNFGFDEFVMKTTDGGQTWKRISLPTGFDFRKIDLHFVDASNGYVHLRRTQSHDEVYFTNDGGQTWTERTPAALRTIGTIQWLPGGIGFAFGNTHTYRYEFIRTTDGGVNWSTVHLPVFDQQSEFAITDIAFSSNDNGFAVGSGGNLLITRNGGTSWQIKNAGYPEFRTFDFADANIGYASSGKGFFKTEDGGRHWQFQSRSDSLTVYDMTFEDAARGVFFGWRNFYYTIGENGSVVSRLSLPVTFISISCLKQKGDSLFASGMTLSPRKNFFLSSGNNGTDWTVTEIPEASGLIVQMERQGNYFYYSDGSGIYRSSTKGTNWTTLVTFSGEYLNGISVLDDGTLLASFQSGKVKRCAPNSTSWNDVDGFDAGEVSDFVTKANWVFAYGKQIREGVSFGAIWRSVDRGLHWQQEDLPVIDNGILDMDIEENLVWATGGFGQVFSFDLSNEVTAVESITPDAKPMFYPVPAKEYLDINLPNGKITYVEFVSAVGTTIPLEAVESLKSVWRVTFGRIPNGVYMVRVYTNQKSYCQRIVID